MSYASPCEHSDDSWHEAAVVKVLVGQWYNGRKLVLFVLLLDRNATSFCLTRGISPKNVAGGPSQRDSTD